MGGDVRLAAAAFIVQAEQLCCLRCAIVRSRGCPFQITHEHQTFKEKMGDLDLTEVHARILFKVLYELLGLLENHRDDPSPIPIHMRRQATNGTRLLLPFPGIRSTVRHSSIIFILVSYTYGSTLHGGSACACCFLRFILQCPRKPNESKAK